MRGEDVSPDFWDREARMKSSPTILCATDFSPCSDAAVEQAAELARAFGYELAILHVKKSVHTESRTCQESLEQTCQRLRDEGLQVRQLQACGDPSEAILAAAKDPTVKYVVLGTQGHVGIQRWTLGSVAAQVLRVANIPVVTVRSVL